MRVTQVDLVPTQQLFHIIGILGSPVCQTLTQHMQLQRQQVIEAGHPRVHGIKSPCFGRRPHLPESLLAYKHQIQSIVIALVELREIVCFAMQAQSGGLYPLKPSVAVAFADEEIYVKGRPRVSVGTDRISANNQKWQRWFPLREFDEVGDVHRIG